MHVVRKESEPVITTLEALLYDPIYSWSVKKPRSDQSQQAIPDISMLNQLSYIKYVLLLKKVFESKFRIMVLEILSNIFIC